MPEIAWFGQTAMLRGNCKRCHGQAFIFDGKFACCGAAAPWGIDRQVVEVASVRRRRLPPLKIRDEILASQDGRCLYCGHRFGDFYRKRGRLWRRKLAWDHLVPFCRDHNNGHENFVAACSVCNHFKSSIIFKTIEEVRRYVLRRSKEEGIEAVEDLSHLPDQIPDGSVG